MIIINLFPVSKGGGLQNAFSLLMALKKSALINYLCLVRKGSELEEFCITNNINFRSFEASFLGRLLFELFFANSVCLNQGAKIVFTLFGNCPIRSGGAVKVSGFARSNIVECDKHFWHFLPWYKRIIKQLMDRVILQLMKSSDVIILETERLKRLSIKNLIFGQSEIRVVKMAASGLIVKKLSRLENVNVTDISTVNIAYITGSHPNKNIPMLAPIFKCLNANHSSIRYNLICTLPNDSYFSEVKEAFNSFGVSSNLINNGFVSSDDIPQLISKSQAMINVAHLESFSNNWVEAWAAKRLLICRKAEYAEESCFNSAVYIDLDNPEMSALKISEAFESQYKLDQYVERGEELLDKMPNSDEKFHQYLRIIHEFL